MDGTGPQGYGSMTGGRRGPCATGVRPRYAGGGYGGGFGGGYGRRNRYYATGLTGWQSAAQTGAAPVAEPVDRLGGIEDRLAEVLDRLERLEAAGKA